MAIAEKVSETVGEWKDELHGSVERLREEVAELKSKLRALVPLGRRRSDVPVRYEPGGTSRDSWVDFGSPLERWFEPLSPTSGLFDMEWPRVDVRDSDEHVRVRAELPGVEDDELDVHVDGNTLTIRGERRTEHEDRDRGYVRHECFHGSFHRTIPLPYEIERDRVEATFRRGVLEVILPKTREARDRVKRIPVRRV